MTEQSREHAMDHVVLVLFENRSLDNMLGHLYGPDDGKVFEGVVGKDLANPVPTWAQHQPADGSGQVAYHLTDDLDAPNPDSGEEYFHTNTQLFNTVDKHNIGKIGSGVTAPWNLPQAGATPTMDGFVTDYISTFTGEVGRQPTYDEYAQIMTGYTPEQLPVLNGLAREFGVFDHWFSEVPSQTFMNRSFWTAATSSGLTINAPMTNFLRKNDAETIFDRLEAHGKTWKVYVMEPCPISFTALIHLPRLKDKLTTNIVPFSQFEEDARNGTLPDFSLIEPNLLAGHGDYHPAMGRSFIPDNVEVPLDPPSAILAGEAFLQRLFDAYRAMDSDTGANVYNTTLFIGWDEPGGTYDHVAPGAVPPPDPAAGPGQLGFSFDRSGYRVPAIVVSPWVEPGSVYNAEHRHTSLIATLRAKWGLGEAFTERDAAAAPIDYVFSRQTPREPSAWAPVKAHPVPEYQVDWTRTSRALSNLGKAATPAILAELRQLGVKLPPGTDSPGFAITPKMGWSLAELLAWHVFPRLAPADSDVQAVERELQVQVAEAVELAQQPS